MKKKAAKWEQIFACILLIKDTWNLKKKKIITKQINKQNRDIHRYREQTGSCQKGGEWGLGKRGEGD